MNKGRPYLYLLSSVFRSSEHPVMPIAKLTPVYYGPFNLAVDFLFSPDDFCHGQAY